MPSTPVSAPGGEPSAREGDQRPQPQGWPRASSPCGGQSHRQMAEGNGALHSSCSAPPDSADSTRNPHDQTVGKLPGPVKLGRESSRHAPPPAPASERAQGPSQLPATHPPTRLRAPAKATRSPPITLSQTLHRPGLAHGPFISGVTGALIWGMGGWQRQRPGAQHSAPSPWGWVSGQNGLSGAETGERAVRPAGFLGGWGRRQLSADRQRGSVSP